LRQVLAGQDLGLHGLHEGASLVDRRVLGFPNESFPLDADGGDGHAVAVVQRHGHGAGPLPSPKRDRAFADSGLLRFPAGLADFIRHFAGNDARDAVFIEGINPQAQEARLLLHDVLDQDLRHGHDGRVRDAGIAEMRQRIGLGPKADFAGGEGIIMQRRHGEIAVEPAHDLVALALDGQ